MGQFYYDKYERQLLDFPQSFNFKAYHYQEHPVLSLHTQNYPQVFRIRGGGIHRISNALIILMIININTFM